MAPGLMACSSPSAFPSGVDDGAKARRVEGRFVNPEGSPTVQNTWRDHAALWWWAAFGASAEALNPPAPAGHVIEPGRALEMLQSHAGQDSITWLGHAAFLIRLNGKWILIDPFLSERASPMAAVGPRRHAEPGLRLDQLPQIDLLIVSHNHYDHLDMPALRQLPGKAHVQVLVPTGLGALLHEGGFERVTELTWGQVHVHDGVSVRSVPAVHFSSRGLFDQDETLWSGYLVETSKTRLYFAGDTAYHDRLFNQLRQDLGPVDVALVPIGAYEPANLMSHVHTNPEQAVQLGRAMGAKTLVGMHWGTLALSTEPPFEAPVRFRSAGRAHGYADDNVWTLAIGETRPMPHR